MFIDPIIKQHCPKGINPLSFHILQRLWQEGRHVSVSTVHTSMRGVNLYSVIQLDNNDGNYDIEM